jgi:hypothetical protein
MAIILNGETGISSIGALSGVTSISATNAALTGITSVASNAADTPVILQDSSSNSNTCRAWVNFNGTGTVAIREDFNVSSITDNNAGDYTVNFTTAMPDADYAVTMSSGNTSANSRLNNAAFAAPTTSSCRVQTRNEAQSGTDSAYVYVSIFR